MTLAETLLKGVDNFFVCSIPIRITFILIPIAIIFQTCGIGNGSWSGSDQSRQGLWKYCHDSGDFSCCEDIADKLGNVPGWLVSTIVFQFLACVTAVISFVAIILYSCVSKTLKNLKVNIVSIVSCLLTAFLLMISASIYGDNYRKSNWLQGHYLSGSFVVVLIAFFLYAVSAVILLVTECHKRRKKHASISPHSRQVTLIDLSRSNTPSSSDAQIISRASPTAITSNRDIPLHWSRMDHLVILKIVELQFGNQEYNEIVNEFKANMGPNYNIIAKVERIQNVQLYQQYLAEKKGMRSINPTGQINERKLWHGTKHQAVDSINLKGFDRSFCGTNGVLYGRGCYFSSSPLYSANYAHPDSHGYKRMYFCKVLIGEYTKGEKNMKVPPAISEGSPIQYNSLVDNTSSPTIFVVFRDAQAYPEYLITFK